MTSVVDWVRRLLGMTPIHRHEYEQRRRWLYIDDNVCLERYESCSCGHTQNVVFSLVVSAADLAEADKRRITSGGKYQ